MTDDGLATTKYMREHIQELEQRNAQLEQRNAQLQQRNRQPELAAALIKRKRPRGAPKRHDHIFYGNFLAMVENAIEMVREENSHKPNAFNALKFEIRPLVIKKRGRAGKIPSLKTLLNHYTKAKKLNS
ncbi:MAG: hypothetical protein O3A65_08110 [Proteobacteria bacterium]|nr:hypothetical protein [Pseudomonadota bacterium]